MIFPLHILFRLIGEEDVFWGNVDRWVTMGGVDEIHLGINACEKHHDGH